MRLIFILLVLIASKALAQQHTLSAKAMQRDLDILHDAWTSLHPGLYRYNTPKEIEADFQKLYKTCSSPLYESRFFILLSQLAQKIKCGHTYLNPLNIDKTTAARILPEKVIPLFFEIIGAKSMVITHTLDSVLPVRRGDEIIAINGIAVKSIMDSLMTVSRSDGNNSKGKKYNNMNESPDEASKYSLFDIYFPLFFPASTNEWTITVINYQEKKERSFNIGLLNLDERKAAYEKRYGKFPVDEASWDYRILDSGTAYMKFGTFAFWNSNFNETRFVDSVFIDLQKRKSVDNLIIDIRGNEGGDNTGDYILSYITSHDLGCDDPDHPCYRFLTVPDTLLPFLSTWDKSFKKPKNPDNFFINQLGLYEKKTGAGDCSYIKTKQSGFKGKVFLLIDSKNSSAGFEMARNFKVNHLGLLIGETTGGTQQGINGGEFFFLNLPESNFEIDLPLIFNYHPNKPDSGIVPDYYVPNTQKAVANYVDAQLQFVQALIKKNKLFTKRKA